MNSPLHPRGLWTLVAFLLLLVRPAFTQNIYTVTGGGSYCAGSLDLGVPVGLSGSQLGYTYQLKRDGQNTGIPLVGLAGLPLSFGLQTQAGTYTVEATEVVLIGTPRKATMNGSAVVTVNQGPTAVTINVLGQALVCPGLSVNLVVNITGGQGPYTVEYAAVSVLGGGGLVTLGTYTQTNYTPGTPIPVTPSVATVYIVTKVTDANGCVLTLPLNPTVGASVNLAPDLTLGTVTVTETVCQGGTVTVTLTGLPINLPVGLSVQVSYRIGSQTGTALLNVGGNGVASFQLNLDPALVGPLNLTVEALTLLGLNVPCVKSFNTVSNQVNIVPKPQGSGTSAQICSGNAVNVDLQSRITNGVASNFTWTVTDNPNVGGESGGAGDNLNQTLSNTTGQPQTVVYTVTPVSEAGSCGGNSFEVTVTVNPGPTASITNTDAQTICPGGTTSIQGNVTAQGNWTLTLSNGQTATGVGNGSFTITVTPAGGTTIYSISSLSDGSGCPTTTGGFTGSKQVTAQDNTPPVFTQQAPSPQTVSPSGNGQVTIPNLVAQTAATDNCGGVTLTQSPAAGSQVAPSNGQVVVTVTATDGNGNQANYTVALTASDTTPPVITQCPTPREVSLGSNCQVSIPNLVSEAQGTDNAGAVTFTQSPAAGSTVSATDGQALTVTLTATDAAGNQATCQVTLTAQDTTPPSLGPAPNQTAVAPTGQATVALNVPAPTAADNCPGVTVTWTATGASPAAGTGSLSGVRFPVGTTTVTFTATDAAGNQSQTTLTVTVTQGTDTTPPVITQCPSGRDVNLGASCQIVVPNLTNEAQGTDNAGAVTFTQSPAAGSTVSATDGQALTVTLTATDAAGNQATCQVTLTAQDTTPPSLGPAPNQTAVAPTGQATVALNVPAPTAADNCPGVTVTWTATGASPAAGTGSLSGVRFPVGTTTVTFTATDAAGNQSQTTLTVTVTQGTDTTPPVITQCPSGRDVNLGASCQIVVPNLTNEAQGTDNAGAVTFTQSPAAGSTVSATDGQALTVTLTATDAAGNQATCQVTLTAQDTTPPSLGPAPNQTAVAPTGQATVALNVPAPTAADNCPGVTVTWTATGASPAAGTGSLSGVRFPVGTTTVTFTATDAAGNQSQTTLTVTVTQGTDTTPPVITQCPSGRDVNLGASCQIVVPNLTNEAQGTDNAGAVTFTQSPAAGSTVSATDGQALTVTLTATDAAGNQATCQVTLTAQDTTPPVFGPVLNVTVQAQPGQNSAVVNIKAPSVRDNCPVRLIWTAPGATPDLGTNSPGNVRFPVGTTTVTFTATDAAGNSSQTSLTVTVTSITDTTPPVITQCPAPRDVSLGSNCQLTIPSLTGEAQGTDNAGNVSFTQSPAAGSTVSAADGQAISVTITATDASGNKATCTVTLTAQDTTLPVFTQQATSPQAVTLNSNGQFVVPNFVSQTVATDNCGPVTVTQVGESGTSVKPNENGQYVVTITATDKAGNQASYSVTLTTTGTGKDTTPPTVTTCASPVFNTDSGKCYATVSFVAPTATDDRPGTLTLAWSAPGAKPASGTGALDDVQFPKGSTKVTYTVTDAAGNSTSGCAFTVVVVDKRKPVFVRKASSPYTVKPNASGQMLVPDLLAQTTAVDNCSPVKVTQSPRPDTLVKPGADGLWLVTITARDSSGNTASYTVTLTTRDTAPGRIGTCPAPVSTYRTDLGRCYATVSFAAPAAESDSVKVAWSAPGATPARGTGGLINVQFPRDTTRVFFMVTRKGGKTDTTCTFRVMVGDNPVKAGTISFTPGFATLLSYVPGQSDNLSTSLTVSGYTGRILRWESAPRSTGTWKPVINTSGDTTITVENLIQTTYYRVVVHDTACGKAVTSAVFPVTVFKSGQVIFKQPVNLTVCEGGQGYFHTLLNPSISEEKTTVLKWQMRLSASAPWTTAPGVSSAEVYVLPNGSASLALSGAQFRMLVVRNDTTTVSDVATLTVVPSAALLQQPQSVVVATGENAVLAAAVAGGNLTYRWQRLVGASDTVFVDLKNQPGKISGVASPVLTVAKVQAAGTDVGRYRLVVTSSCGVLYSNVVTIALRGTNQAPSPSVVQAVQQELPAKPVTAATPQPADERVSVYPNPVANGYSFRVRVAEAVRAKLYFFGQNGLPEDVVTQVAENGELEVRPVRRLNPGVYYLKVETARGVHTLKVLIE